MINKPNIVLDTNILLVSIFKTSPYYRILEALDRGEFKLFLSNEIITEYEEVISSKFNPSIAHKTFSYLLSLPNVFLTPVYYRWALLSADSDDNKFVDCAIAANADFLVTNDKHFSQLKDIDFPKVQLLDMEGFMNLLNSLEE